MRPVCVFVCVRVCDESEAHSGISAPQIVDLVSDKDFRGSYD